MSYIPRERRLSYDFSVNDLVQQLRDTHCCLEDVNYVITRLVLGSLMPSAGQNYHSLVGCISVLRDSADEIQRRLLTQCKDNAMARNGDLWELREKQ